MQRRRWLTAWVARAVALCASVVPLRAPAGDWHRDRSLVCSDCHTIHNSSRGTPARYDGSADPATLLLRAETTTKLCLACHGNAARRGVEVTVPTNFDPPGGGFPADLSDPYMQAHSLGTEPVLPPDGDTPVVMACVTCHDPHGNGSYRNLKASPSGTGRSPDAPIVLQGVLANGSNAETVYARANVTYVAGLSAWCMDCHNLMVPGVSDHPWDVPISGSWFADWARWSQPLENRVPTENPTGAAAPDTGDRVFCLSCHKAHGTPNYGALIYADGATLDSTCQQCHNQ